MDSEAARLLSHHPVAARYFLLGLARDTIATAPPQAFASALAASRSLIERADSLLGTLGAHGQALLERRVLQRPAGQTTAEAFSRFTAPRTLRDLQRSQCRSEALEAATPYPPGTRMDAVQSALRARGSPARRPSGLPRARNGMHTLLLLTPLVGSALAHHVHAPMQLGGALRTPEPSPAPAVSLLAQCRSLDPANQSLAAVEAATTAISDWDAIESVPVNQLDAFASCLRRVQRDLRAMTDRLRSRRRELMDRPGARSDQTRLQVDVLASLIERVRDMSTDIFDGRAHVKARIGDPSG